MKAPNWKEIHQVESLLKEVPPFSMPPVTGEIAVPFMI